MDFSPQILLPLKSKSSLGLSLLARQQIIAILWIAPACLFIGSGLDLLIDCTCERFAQAAKSLPGKQFLTTLLNNDLWDVLPELCISACWLTKCFHEMELLVSLWGYFLLGTILMLIFFMRRLLIWGGRCGQPRRTPGVKSRTGDRPLGRVTIDPRILLQDMICTSGVALRNTTQKPQTVYRV